MGDERDARRARARAKAVRGTRMWHALGDAHGLVGGAGDDDAGDGGAAGAAAIVSRGEVELRVEIRERYPPEPPEPPAPAAPPAAAPSPFDEAAEPPPPGVDDDPRELCFTEEGDAYWYDAATGESEWCEIPGADDARDSAAAVEDETWQYYHDDFGNPYWYNTETGESEWGRA